LDRTSLKPHKLPVAHKAMPLHPVGAAPMPQVVTIQPAPDGKQQLRMVLPARRPADDFDADILARA
jgi:hypothetical protein